MDKMIDPVDLQAFLNKIEGGSVAVDLLKIGQKYHQENAPSGNKNSKYNGNFRVALDIEDCLDRFYGGYYSDWACGGQWNRAYQFVQLLANAFKNAHVEVIVFFDGTMKKNKKLSFERNDFRQKTISVLKHIRMIGTPPPKIWWLPPSGIKTTLRNALRSVNIQVAQTVTDHTIEIIEYFHEQKLDAILGLHPDFIIANTSRYFSSHDLRLSYKGALETKEFMVSKLLSSLKLTADHLPFIAVFLGGYTLIDDIKLKSIHECLKIDAGLDFEARIRKIAEIVRNSPTTDIDEFIKQLNLAEFENDIKESVEYYQRRGKFSGKKYLGQKKQRQGNNTSITTNNNNISSSSNENNKSVIIESTPFASETNENDEIARKMLNEVSNLVDDETASTTITTTNTNTISNGTNSSGNTGKSNKSDNKELSGKNLQPFVYTLPGEVLKTSLTRHQRGIMDGRIYQLLTLKEIILPQILEDEQYREIPSVHLFYRPARQMIYAILFNMYHQKYLCSKRNTSAVSNTGGDKKDGKKDKKDITTVGQQQKPPEIQVAEWIWSPQNEYKKPEFVTANPLPWAVPTIQRLWFGMAFEDKQRRMKAFLTVMRSDSTLMLNRGYVPQHMLVMACVLRYIVTSPDRNILTRQELDAFLATAFSPQLPMVEFTQELVLPGVHLRGVYLATLFMQGVETASLANDACGVPLPWTMINPWLFFDGKLFHLKLKMSTYVATLRELCDDHIEIVLKIERFRKAILEDVEHFLLPAAHMVDPMYRPGFLPQPTLPLTGYNKNQVTGAASLHPLATAAANSNGALFYNPQTSYFSLSQALMHSQREIVTGVNPPLISGRNNNNRNNNGGQRQNNRKGYQLKVGGIVTGSWAATNGNAAAAAAAVAAANRTLFGPPGNRLGNRLTGNLAGRLGLHHHNRNGGVGGSGGSIKSGGNVNIRLPRNANQNNLTGRSISRAYGNKMNRNRNRNKRKDNRKNNTNNKSETTGNNDNKKDNAVVTNKDDIKKTITTNNTTSDTTNSTINTTTTAETNLNTTSNIETKTDIDNVSEKLKDMELGIQCTVELQNGTIVLASDLANSMCDVILKDEEENDVFNEQKITNTTQSPIKSSIKNSTTTTTPTKILQNNKNISDITTNQNNKLTVLPSTTIQYTILNESLDSSIDSVQTNNINNNNNNNNKTNTNSDDIGGGGDNINNNDEKLPDTGISIISKKPRGKKNCTASNNDGSDGVVGGHDADVDEMGQGDVSVKG